MRRRGRRRRRRRRRRRHARDLRDGAGWRVILAEVTWPLLQGQAHAPHLARPAHPPAHPTGADDPPWSGSATAGPAYAAPRLPPARVTRPPRGSLLGGLASRPPLAGAACSALTGASPRASPRAPPASSARVPARTRSPQRASAGRHPVALAGLTGPARDGTSRSGRRYRGLLRHPGPSPAGARRSDPRAPPVGTGRTCTCRRWAGPPGRRR